MCIGSEYREALKRILELRNMEKSRKVSRSIEDSIKIGVLARVCFMEMYEVLVWGKEERILRVKIYSRG